MGDDMNYQKFRSLVTEMRAAQKEYFRHRDSECLDRSKRLEREVDKELRETGQAKLFEEGAE
jgi:hypothetical protein